MSRRGSTTPGEKQYAKLLALASGSAGLSFRKRETEPLLRRGWVTAEWCEPFYQWVRITPDGLRALASGVEKYGLPELGPKPSTTRRVCSDCGSAYYHYETVDADKAIAEAT